jgi:hypothetical protein
MDARDEFALRAIHELPRWVPTTVSNVQGFFRRFPVAVAAMGIVVMGIGAFLPFVTWPCWQCLVIGDQPPVSVASLAGGYDNWLMLLTLLTLAAAAAGHLANIRRRLLAAVVLTAAVGALALAVFDGNQPGRLFHWAVLSGDQTQASYWIHPPPTGLGIGFYVFLVGAVVAITGASAMVLNLSREHGRPGPRTCRQSGSLAADTTTDQS